MKRSILTAVLFLSITTHAKAAGQLAIQVSEVLDLATYGDLLQTSIELGSEPQDHSWEIKTWNYTTANTAPYTLHIKLSVKPVFQSYAVLVQEILKFNGEPIKVVLNRQWVLEKDKAQEFDVAHWDNGVLAVRQTSSFRWID